jgi:acyl homoserine lactone synthase
MILIIENYNLSRYRPLVDQMFRLRASVFRDRLGWDVSVIDGMERDRYDDLSPVYIIYADDSGREVKGSLRLLPTTGPTLLGDTFADTIPDAAALSAPTIWECTRFCINEDALGARGAEETLFASAVLFAALGEVAIKAGIESILGNFDAGMLRLYRRIGCEVEVLGSTRKYGRPVYLGAFTVSEPILKRIKARWPMPSAHRPTVRMPAAGDSTLSAGPRR